VDLSPLPVFLLLYVRRADLSCLCFSSGCDKQNDSNVDDQPYRISHLSVGDLGAFSR
jgi:hypothetical protein